MFVILLFQEKSQEFCVCQSGRIISSIQNGVYIVCVVFNLFGVKLSGFYKVSAQAGDHQSGYHTQLDPAHQIVVGYCLQIVPLYKISGQKAAKFRDLGRLPTVF